MRFRSRGFRTPARFADGNLQIPDWDARTLASRGVSLPESERLPELLHTLEAYKGLRRTAMVESPVAIVQWRSH